MTAAAFIDSQGSSITIDGTVVTGISGMSGLGSGQAADRDRTTLADTTFKRFGIGLQDGGTVQIDVFVNTEDPGQQKLWDAYINRTRHVFVLTLPNARAFTFNAYCKQFSQDESTDTDLKGKVSIRIDGAISGGFPAPS
jgi:hypothetical protein